MLDKKTILNRAEKIVKDKLVQLRDYSPQKLQKVLHELEVHQIELEMQNEELRQTYIQLQEAKERYIDLYDMAPVCYCTLDEKGFITDANLKTLLTLGLGKEKVLGHAITNFIYSEDQDIYYINQKSSHYSVNPPSCELRVKSSNGALIWMHLLMTQGRDHDGKRISRLVLSDVSEQKRVEEELKNKDKMMIVQSRYAAMGEMISMIAHQWRQPLNIIGIAIANIQTKQALEMLDEKSIDENLEIISGNILYMSDTIDDFRNFFKPDSQKEFAIIEDILRVTLKVIGTSLLSNSIEVNIQNHSKTALFIHKNSLVQVLLNILANAKDALLSKHVKLALITITVNETEDKIILSICDNAGGIPHEIMNTINQPYFTTKKLNGTGLGIYISQTIIEKYFFGALTWYNNSAGACFVITLNKSEKKGKN